ncbi:histone-lysine N-methyltransferase PRDM9-like [Mytilus trossulus]|uniref:histone-lysine N-methyltransferase PRDM9-like n=1 Tax=Mytilus trossulus TaxID=6551 RepID=UPI003003E93D
MKKNFEIPKLANMEQSDFRKFEEDARSGDIEQYFTKTQMASLSDYEKLRYRNMKKNYEMMVKMGLPAQKPEFMKKQIKNPSTKQTDFASKDEWKPSSSKKNIAQKPTFMQRSKKKRRVKHTDDSDSDEEWRPSSEKAKKSANPPVFKLLKKTRKAKSEKMEQTCAEEKSRKSDEENEEVHRYPQRQLPRTNYMYLEVPDDDEFIYCEDCEREYEGDCPVHPCIHIYDSKSTTKSEERAMETIPEGLSVRESRIPNAGLGVFAEKTFQQRSRFGPYQGEVTTDPDKAHSTGYAWQIYTDGTTSHYIDANNKTKSNWMRYVNCARNEDEQNLIAYQYKGQIFYRSFKDIAKGTELLVWYGQDYGKDLGIDRVDIKSLLKPRYINGEVIYGCPLCKMCFNSGRFMSNHLKYRHSTKLEWMLNDELKGEKSRLHHTISHRKEENIRKTFISSKKLDTLLKEELPNLTGDPLYSCYKCSKGCSSRQDLEIHMKCHTQTFTCKLCSQQCSSDIQLDIHMKTHTGDKPYKCDVCGNGFNVNCNLQIHMRTHTGDKPYKCDVCGKGFSANCNLQIHMRTHTGDKPYKCDICGKGFNVSHHLQGHMRTHTGDKPYKCDVCGKGFSVSSSLQRHMRTHTGDKPYKCDVCDKGFSDTGNLQKHMRTHTGDKPYKCDVCGKGFSVSSSLQTHMRTHTGDKPYKCDVCGKGFSDFGNSQVHMRKHTGDKPYKCDICGKGFSQNGDLQKHMRTHTGDKPYKCDVCGKAFSDSIAYRRHKRTHVHTGDKPCI